MSERFWGVAAVRAVFLVAGGCAGVWLGTGCAQGLLSCEGTVQEGGPCGAAGYGGAGTAGASTGGTSTSSTGSVEGGDPTSEATSLAIDPAHDNAQPNDVVASPLHPLWTAQLGGASSYPIVTGGRVIVAAGGAQPNVRALDLATGHLLWGPIVIGAEVWLAYDGGHVYALNGSGSLTALDVTTGTKVWTTQLEGQNFFSSPPVAAEGKVYVNGLGEGGITYAVDGVIGATVWTAGTFDGSDGAVAVAGGVVYEAEACDQLSAFDALTGLRDWYHSTDCTGGGGEAPAVYQGRIWERDWAMGNVIIDGTGQSVGSFTASVIPSFHGSTVFYLNSHTLSAVDLQSSTLKWSFSGDGQLCTSAAIAGGGGQVFVGSQSGNVYELDEATGAQISVSAAGAPVSCGSETQSMALASNHLFVPAGDTLVVY